MGLAPDTLTFDTAEPVVVATFWAGALAYDLADADPEGSFVADPSKRSRGLFFQPVPEPKIVKNRVHLDLRPAMSMAQEVERFRDLGATELRYVDEGHGSWTVMRDPEDNEFCVLRASSEGGKRATRGIDSVVVDSDDHLRVADFWVAALGYRELEAGEDGVEIVGDRGGDPMLSFVRVPGLGATVRGFIEEGGSFWTQMRDPEGNEFCVLRGPDDGWSPDEL